MDRVTAVTATGATLVLQLPRVKTGGGGGRETVYLDEVHCCVFLRFLRRATAQRAFLLLRLDDSRLRFWRRLRRRTQGEAFKKAEDV